MIDIEKIGMRIKEERKSILKISQEKMAEDLGMYQADISNMEKVKSGSGITDLLKLDMISEYFNIPLETLLFGREDRNMLRYHGSRMQLKEAKKKIPKTHAGILRKLTGVSELTMSVLTYECGPYTLYSMMEEQMMWTQAGNARDPDGRPVFVLPKLHTYLFFGMEIVGVMVTDRTILMEHIFRPHQECLQKMIQPDVLDVTDVIRTLNPYWALYLFSEGKPDSEELMNKMYSRMDELRAAGQNRPVLYIESVYIREDCRRNGLFRMYIDFLKLLYKGSIIWLNMEPTAGDELDSEYSYMPAYSISDLGQLNINAAIAEKVGFTVDPDVWHRQVEKLDENGDIIIEPALVRKCAYFLPKEIRNITANDGDLLAKGRAIQKIMHQEADEEQGGSIDLRTGCIGDAVATEVLSKEPDGKAVYATVITYPSEEKRYIVSLGSLLRKENDRILEEYSSLEMAEASEYYDILAMAESLNNMHPMSSE